AVDVLTATGTPLPRTFINSDLADNRESLALITLGPGQFRARVRGERLTLGTFRLEVFLVGDADGDRQVSLTDVAHVHNLLGAVAGDSRYRVEADANLDGQITSQDESFAQTNVGDSTRINPLLLEATLSPSPIQLPNGTQATNSRNLTIKGNTLP